MRTFLGKSDFYWRLMVLAEQWQRSLHANVLSVQREFCSYNVPSIVGKRTGYEGTGPAFFGVSQTCLAQTAFGSGTKYSF